MSGHYCARITKDAHGQLRCAECGRLMRRDEQGWIVPAE